MSTFVLLHGAFHGSWCWQYLQGELEALGHRTVAPDLPMDDPAAGWPEYVATVKAALPAYPAGDLVLVAHSRAGRLAPLLLDLDAVRHVVLVSASIVGGVRPGPYTTSAIPARRPDRPAPVYPTDEWGRAICPPERAADVFFHDCSPDVAEWAMQRLRPQVQLIPIGEPRWRPVAASYVACTRDRASDPDWMRAAARERLGVEAVAFDSGHSPYLARPAAFAALLDDLADARAC